MKIVAITLAVVLPKALGQGIHLRKNANQVYSSADNSLGEVGDLFLSEQCAGFREENGMIDPDELLADVGSDAVVDLVCSNFGRFMVTHKVEGYLSHNDSGNPCAVDMVEYIELHLDSLHEFEANEDESACRDAFGSGHHSTFIETHSNKWWVSAWQGFIDSLV
eukprot:scaffold30372_cov70-Cyclotella_meneghiniana.AAC.4